MSNDKVEKISYEPLRYISRSYNDFTEYMESDGYTVEQMGRGFDLKKGNYKNLVVAEGFMGIYEIFSEWKRIAIILIYNSNLFLCKQLVYCVF